jgi:Mrp family chromosome partitioning ATPase
MTETPKRVIFTMGGKSGIAKTGVVVGLAVQDSEA